MLPKFPIQVGKDIAEHHSSKAVWKHRYARLLALLWRPCHLVNEYYWEETLTMGKEIDKLPKPITKEGLMRILGYPVFRDPRTNYMGSDLEEFIEEAVPYFRGEIQAEFEITK